MVNLEFDQMLPQLTALVEQFDRQRILVVGDLTLDEFVTGEVERLSREAPVLILRHEHTLQVPGGGANAIYNLAKLGAQVRAVGVVGADPQGVALQGILGEAGVDTRGIFVDPLRPTVTKTRISAHARQSVTQQIVRLDRKSEQVPSELVQSQMAEYIASQIEQVDGVVCSDYGEGVMQAQVIAAALGHGLVVVDTQRGLERYQGATIFTPNLPEAELAVGYKITTANIDQAAKDLLALTQAQQILITRGEDGMSLFDRQGNHQHVPAFNRTQVFDVTGAGDTVVAALTLGLAAGGDCYRAMVLGNLAASIVVRQFGTSTTNRQELLKAIATLALQ